MTTKLLLGWPFVALQSSEKGSSTAKPNMGLCFEGTWVVRMSGLIPGADQPPLAKALHPPPLNKKLQCFKMRILMHDCFNFYLSCSDELQWLPFKRKTNTQNGDLRKRINRGLWMQK